MHGQEYVEASGWDDYDQELKSAAYNNSLGTGRGTDNEAKL